MAGARSRSSRTATKAADRSTTTPTGLESTGLRHWHPGWCRSSQAATKAADHRGRIDELRVPGTRASGSGAARRRSLPRRCLASTGDAEAPPLAAPAVGSAPSWLDHPQLEPDQLAGTSGSRQGFLGPQVPLVLSASGRGSVRRTPTALHNFTAWAAARQGSLLLQQN